MFLPPTTRGFDIGEGLREGADAGEDKSGEREEDVAKGCGGGEEEERDGAGVVAV